MAGDADGQWHDVAALNDVPSGEMSACEVGEIHLALYNIDGTVFATDNVCTHAYALLTDGWLDNNVVECPLHGGQFDVCTGKAVCSPAEIDLQTYPARVTDGRIEVLLPAAR
jgi:nitrite reductase/ring-hydroxylating ferredoxin subunit